MPQIITELTTLVPSPENYTLYHHRINHKDYFSLKSKTNIATHFTFKPLEKISIDSVVFGTAEELINAFNETFNVDDYAEANITEDLTPDPTGLKFPNVTALNQGLDGRVANFKKSNESLSIASSRKDDIIYGLLDQYTGEAITLSKVTGTPVVDGIIYFQLGSEYFKRNYTEINVDWFGCVGDGIVDDTANIQKALDTDCKIINFTEGKTYLVNGGLTSSITNRKINMNGATIKLKDNATIKTMLFVTGQYTDVIGGTWDGNKSNGNSVNIAPSFGYDSCNISINADYCFVQNIASINTYGMAIKGAGTISYLLAENNTIKDVELYGIFIDGNNSNIMQYGNKAINNIIDCSFNPAFTQGILFTSGTTPNGYQTDYEISNNKVTGSLVATNENNICIAVRGNKGIFSKNITIGGSMGISEGGNKTTYVDNIITDLAPNGIGYGIEIAGSDLIITGNIIKNSKFGVIGTNSIDYKNINITNNSIDATDSFVKIVIQNPFQGRNYNISSNVLNGKGIYLGGNTSNIKICNNTIIGIDAANGNKAIFFDNIVSSGEVFISDNKISKFFAPFSLYSIAEKTYSNFYASHNDCSIDVSVSQSGWFLEGAAIIGNNVVYTFNNLGSNNVKNILDQKNNVFEMRSDSFNNPEGLLTAGVGSIYFSKNANGGSYFKLAGTGNTGWQPMFKSYLTMASQANSIAPDVATLVTDFNALILKLKNSGLMTS